MIKRKPKTVTTNAILETRVAIDVGLHSIKFAYFKDHLLHLDEFPLFEQPKDLRAVKDQELTSSQMSAINKALTMINPNAEFIVSPQPSQQVLTRVLYLPPETTIKTYLEKELPFEPEQFGFDTRSLDAEEKKKKSKKTEKKSTRIAVAATDLDFIQRSISLLGEFQLQIKRLTPNAVALLNYLMLSSDGSKDQPIVFLDMGALHTHLIVFKGRGEFLARTIGIGGNHINQELAGKLNVDFDTAERIKIERKLIDDGLFDSAGSSTSMPMFQAINIILYGLIDEIKSSMTYFEDFFVDDLSGASILLAGGASSLHNLDRFIAKELDLPVSKAENAVHALDPGIQFGPQFASVIGLLGQPSHPGLLDLNLINNIEGMLFKLKDGDYYLTKDGFVNKKKYKKTYQKTKSLKPSVLTKGESIVEEPGLTPLAFVKELPARISGLFRGERFEMPSMRFSFGEMEFLGPVKDHLKTILVVIGGLFLLAAMVNYFIFKPQKMRLDKDISTYLSKRAELDRIKGSMARGTGETSGAGGITATRSDKIVWAAKLRFIASAIPEGVWVSDLMLKGNPPALVLSCHVASYGEDHLKDIATFIENLKANGEFVKDFADVLFRSAQRNSKEKDVYDFTLTFPLKRKVVEEISETIKVGG